MTSVMDNCNAIWQFQYSPLIQLFFHSSRQVFNISSSLWKSPLSSLSSADDSTFHLIMKIKIFGTELQQFSPITFIHLPFFCTKVSGIMISLPYFTKNKLLVLPSLIFLCVYWLLFFFFFFSSPQRHHFSNFANFLLHWTNPLSKQPWCYFSSLKTKSSLLIEYWCPAIN